MNATELIARAKLRATLPKTLNYSDQNILDVINEELATELIPKLLSAKGNLLDAKVDVQLVSGQSEYPVPNRAALSKVRLLTYVDAAGTESKPLKQVEQADIHDYAATGVPTGFYFTQAGIAVLPASDDGVGQLRIRYPRRPSPLVLAASVATVVSASDTVLTVDATPAAIIVGSKVDIGQALSPFKPLADDLVVTARDATHITIGAGGLSALALVAGDFVTLQRTAFVPAMPEEWHIPLALRAAARLQNDARDVNARNATLQLAQAKEKELGALQDARADGNPKRLNAWRGHHRHWGWR